MDKDSKCYKIADRANAFIFVLICNKTFTVHLRTVGPIHISECMAEVCALPRLIYAPT